MNSDKESPNYQVLLGNRIRKLINAYDSSPKTISGQTGISESVLCRLLNGQCVNPSAWVIANIADALGIPVTEIFEDEDLLNYDFAPEQKKRKALRSARIAEYDETKQINKKM